MSEFVFACPHCGAELEIDDSLAGQVLECPACHKGIVVPRDHAFSDDEVLMSCENVPEHTSADILIPDEGNHDEVDGGRARQGVRGRLLAKISVLLICAILVLFLVKSMFKSHGIDYRVPVDPEVEFLVADSFWYGDGVKQDFSKAVEWFRRSAMHGNFEACFSLAVCYARGRGVRQDFESAVMWLFLGVGDDEISFYERFPLNDRPLGLYTTRQGMPSSTWGRELHEAYQYVLSYASKIDDPAAGALLGTMELCGAGARRDYTSGIERLRSAASKGVCVAQFLLGGLLQNRNEKEESVLWFRRAVDGGSPYARFYLALAYINGGGIERDPRQAEGLLQEAALKGHVNAMKYLAKLYREGRHLGQNMKMSRGLDKLAEPAMKWNFYGVQDPSVTGQARARPEDVVGWLNGCRKSSRLMRLAILKELEELERNHMLPADPLLWVKNQMRSAAEKGCPSAQLLMAELARTRGMEDHEEYVKWITKAAEQGVPLAQQTIAGFYSTGENGFPRDLPKALSLYYDAIYGGSLSAYGEMLENLGILMQRTEYAKLLEEGCREGCYVSRKILKRHHELGEYLEIKED